MRKVFTGILLVVVLVFGTGGCLFAANDSIIEQEKKDEGNVVGGGYRDSWREDSSTSETKKTEPKKEVKTSTNRGSSTIDCGGLLGCGDIDVDKDGVEETYIYQKFVPYFIELMLNLGAGLAVLMIVYSGGLYLTSGGEPENQAKATKNIIFATVGLIVMILSRAIVDIVQSLPFG